MKLILIENKVYRIKNKDYNDLIKCKDLFIFYIKEKELLDIIEIKHKTILILNEMFNF